VITREEMTASATCPRESELPQGGGAVERRSRKLYVLWAIALSLLLAFGLFCWLVLVPAYKARSRLNSMQYCTWKSDKIEDAFYSRTGPSFVAEVGGPRRCVMALSLYISLPDRFAPRKHEAVRYAAFCGPSGASLLESLRERDDPGLAMSVRQATEQAKDEQRKDRN
jgi:hypothetical protein